MDTELGGRGAEGGGRGREGGGDSSQQDNDQEQVQPISLARFVELLAKHKTEKLIWEEGVAEHSFKFT